METVATRRPAIITGRASGSSIRNSSRGLEYPRPVADSTTSAGTDRSPSSIARTRIVSAYRARPTTTVVAVMPVNGTISGKSASDGIVYRPVLAPSTVDSRRGSRRVSSASGKANPTPRPTAAAVIHRCSAVAVTISSLRSRTYCPHTHSLTSRL